MKPSQPKAFQFFDEKINLITQVEHLIKSKDIVKSVEQLIKDNQLLNRQTKSLPRKAKDKEAHFAAQKVNGVMLIASEVNLDAKSIKNIAFELTKTHDNLLLVLGAKNDGKVTLTVAIAKKLVSDRALNASDIVRELSKDINGGGGGQASFATAGGKPQWLSDCFRKST